MPEVQLELHAMLRKLHLSGMADNFGDLALKAANAHLTYETYLAEVVRCECVLREQRRIARLLRQSGLPADKTFRTLQLDRFPLVVQHERDEMEVLFTLLAERYERRSVAISTNLIFSEWERIFKDPMTTLAAIDRVVHHSVILDLMGMDSYRAQEASAELASSTSNR